MNARTWLAGITTIGLISLVLGCDTTKTAGGPGATANEAKKPIIGESDNAFTLSTPMMGASIKQGESKNVTISIDRGKNFDQDVTIRFDGLPNGVTIDPATPSIKHGDKQFDAKVTAAADAAIGDYKVKVVGHPATGPDATSEMKVAVSSAK